MSEPSPVVELVLFREDAQAIANLLELLAKDLREITTKEQEMARWYSRLVRTAVATYDTRRAKP